MYRVLIGKMAENNISRKQIAEKMGVTEKSVGSWINGTVNINLLQAKQLRDIVAPEMSIDELFSVRQQKQSETETEDEA